MNYLFFENKAANSSNIVTQNSATNYVRRHTNSNMSCEFHTDLGIVGEELELLIGLFSDLIFLYTTALKQSVVFFQPNK